MVIVDPVPAAEQAGSGASVVAHLGVAPAAGQPVEPRAALRLVAGVGPPDDRYALGRGHWQDWPDREVTLVELETAEAVGVPPLALRRNVVTRGVRLATLEGRRFRVGTALLEGVRPCDPCAYLEGLLGRPGLVDALRGRGGLRARVVEDGVVRVGDAIVPEP